MRLPGACRPPAAAPLQRKRKAVLASSSSIHDPRFPITPSFTRHLASVGPRPSSMNHRDTSNPPAWARRVNRTWLVHGGLNATADAWLSHLEQTDPARLLASCEIARALSRGPDHTHDPKPWFYAGLFSLASAAEARHHLATHRFTAAAIPALAQDAVLNQWATTLSPASRDLLDRLRKSILSLTQDRSEHPPSCESPSG